MSRRRSGTSRRPDAADRRAPPRSPACRRPRGRWRLRPRRSRCGCACRRRRACASSAPHRQSANGRFGSGYALPFQSMSVTSSPSTSSEPFCRTLIVAIARSIPCGRLPESAPAAATIGRCDGRSLPLLRAGGPDVPRRARRTGDHRLRRGVLRRGGARDGRVGRLADAALQLRAALPEADPLLLAHRGDLRGDRRRRGGGPPVGGAVSGIGAGLRHRRHWPGAGTTTTRRCWPAPSWRPASATSRSAAWRCPTCRWRSSSPRPSRAHARSRSAIACRVRASGCVGAALAAALGFLTKGPLALVLPARGRRADRRHRAARSRGCGAADLAVAAARRSW